MEETNRNEVTVVLSKEQLDGLAEAVGKRMLSVIEQKGGEAGEQARQQREARNRDEDDNDIDDDDEDEDDASSTLGLNWNRLLEPAALGMAGVIGAAIALWVLRKDD